MDSLVALVSLSTLLEKLLRRNQMKTTFILTWHTAINFSISLRNWTDTEECVVIRYIALAVILARVVVVARVSCRKTKIRRSRNVKVLLLII